VVSLLAAQTLPSGRFEIVVADNKLSCGLREVEAVCGTLARVVPARIQGAGPAGNAAIAASRGVILAFIDFDCRPSPDWLESEVEALATADMVGGRVDVDVLDPGNPKAVEAFEMVFAFDFKRYLEKKHFSGTAICSSRAPSSTDSTAFARASPRIGAGDIAPSLSGTAGLTRRRRVFLTLHGMTGPTS